MAQFFSVSDAGSIAVHAMIYIAGSDSGKLAHIRDIAHEFTFSEAHVAKVLNRLVKSGLLSATRGPSGGYRLAQPANRISLLDIYTAIEGGLQKNRCLFSIRSCGDGECLLGGFFGEESRRIEHRLAETMLADVSLEKPC